MVGISIHYVVKIELRSRFRENSNSRTIRITDRTGAETELTVYGNTDALDALPQADDFQEFRNSSGRQRDDYAQTHAVDRAGGRDHA